MILIGKRNLVTFFTCTSSSLKLNIMSFNTWMYFHSIHLSRTLTRRYKCYVKSLGWEWWRRCANHQYLFAEIGYRGHGKNRLGHVQTQKATNSKEVLQISFGYLAVASPSQHHRLNSCRKCEQKTTSTTVAFKVYDASYARRKTEQTTGIFQVIAGPTYQHLYLILSIYICYSPPSITIA